MKLEFRYHDICGLEAAAKTEVQDGRLRVCLSELAALLKEDPRVKTADIYLLSPGEETRVIGVKDIIEPRVKLDKNGQPAGYFGGMFGDVDMTGHGITLALAGAAVVVAGPWVQNIEGILDMSGIGASYTAFSQTYNVVVWVDTVPLEDWNEKKEVMNSAGLKAAVYLASAAAGRKPDRIREYCWDCGDRAEKQLPRITHINMVESLRQRSYSLYGMDTRGMLPTIISPLEAVDGALVNTGGRVGGHKNLTYHQQNNPVIMEALERHGRDVILTGVIIKPELSTYKEQDESSTIAIGLARQLQLSGAIITEEQAGAPDADLMMTCRKAEKAGIKTVLITDECAGDDGMNQGLADTTLEADAVVSCGNCEEQIFLPPMANVIGDMGDIGRLSGTFTDSLQPDKSIRTELIGIPGSCNEMGAALLRCRTI